MKDYMNRNDKITKVGLFSEVTTHKSNCNQYNETTIHSKITMAGDVVPYYTVTALVPTLK